MFSKHEQDVRINVGIDAALMAEAMAATPAQLERELAAFEIRPMLGQQPAIQAARNYHALRSLGVSIRKSIDLIIGTDCGEYGHELPHDDRDFEPVRVHPGLQVI